MRVCVRAVSLPKIRYSSQVRPYASRVLCAMCAGGDEGCEVYCVRCRLSGVLNRKSS